nr:BACON domain-containing protein [Alistipes sp.]
MKKLFYLLLALPLVFAACEPDTPEQDVEKEAVLTLTSEAEMNFEAEGGEGVITYTAEWKDVTRYSPVPEPVVEATCEAQWVENLTVAENITFTVLANEADARETKVVVTYGGKSFEVAVKQAAKQNDQPEPPTGVNLEAKYLYGDYYGDEYSPGVGNY